LAASAFAFMFAMVTAWVMALGGSTALGILSVLMVKPWLEKRITYFDST
jgi:hypothetical protein